MEHINFDNIADFCENIVDEFTELEKPEFNCISVIARYEYAKKIIQELILSGLEINSITDFAPFEQDGYDDEYIITIDEYGIWVQPEKYKDCDGKYGEYINVFSDICYVMNDSNISILNYINHTSNEVFIVKLTDHERCNDCDYENCNCHDETYLHTSEDEDGNAHGFTASRSDGDSYMSYSYYSSDELSHEDIQKMLKAVGFQIIGYVIEESVCKCLRDKFADSE